MGTFQQLIEFAQNALGYDEAHARRFAEGRDGPNAERLWAQAEAADRARYAETTANRASTHQATAGAAALTPMALQVAEAVQQTLQMAPDAAHQYAAQLQERETRRGGAEHAEAWLTVFATSLHSQARAA